MKLLMGGAGKAGTSETGGTGGTGGSASRTGDCETGEAG